MPRWIKGQSGNPNGRPKCARTFTDALRAKGTAEELAELAWKAAREGEPWAIQMIYNRLDPHTTQVKLTHEVENENPVNYSRLTDEEIKQLEGLLERAATPVAELEGGANAANRCRATPMKQQPKFGLGQSGNPAEFNATDGMEHDETKYKVQTRRFRQ